MEIKFRGKRVDGVGWAYGFLSKIQYHEGGLFVPCIQVLKEDDEGDYITSYEVIPESIGIYTGLRDKNGVEIYGAVGEKGGDVVTDGSLVEMGASFKAEVFFEDGSFKLRTNCGCDDCARDNRIGNYAKLEVIGQQFTPKTESDGR